VRGSGLPRTVVIRRPRALAVPRKPGRPSGDPSATERGWSMKTAVIAAVVSAVVAAASGTAATIVVTSKNIKTARFRRSTSAQRRSGRLRASAGREVPRGQGGLRDFQDRRDHLVRRGQRDPRGLKASRRFALLAIRLRCFRTSSRQSRRPAPPGLSRYPAAGFSAASSLTTSGWGMGGERRATTIWPNRPLCTSRLTAPEVSVSCRDRLKSARSGG
jgi:hypothetical protein